MQQKKNLFRTTQHNTTGILNHLKTRHQEEIEKYNIHVQRTSESIPKFGLRGLVEPDGKPLDIGERNGEPDQKRTGNILDKKDRVRNPLKENDTSIESENLIDSNQVIQNKAMNWNLAYKLEEGTMCKYCGNTFINILGCINHVYREHPEKNDVQEPKNHQKLIVNKKERRKVEVYKRRKKRTETTPIHEITPADCRDKFDGKIVSKEKHQNEVCELNPTGLEISGDIFKVSSTTCRIHPFSKITVTFDPVMRFGCPSGFRISLKFIYIELIFIYRTLISFKTFFHTIFLK